MAGVTGFGVVESRDPHENAGLHLNIVFAAGIEPARHLEGPAACCPSRDPADRGPIVGHQIMHDDAGDNGADGDGGVNCR